MSSGLPARPAKREKAAAKKAEATEERVRIMLEDNDQIGPAGQFIQVNGRSFQLQAGVEADVPRCVLDVLDHAVMGVPIKNASDQVIGFRERLRFPYRVITEHRKA